jgi:uncharacterized protein YkwD
VSLICFCGADLVIILSVVFSKILLVAILSVGVFVPLRLNSVYLALKSVPQIHLDVVAIAPVSSHKEIGDRFVLGASIGATPSATPKASQKSAPAPKLRFDQQLFQALNEYRSKKGRAYLSWDEKLASFAKSRSDYLLTLGSLDNHAGFKDFISNKDGFAVLGFNALGENQSWSSSPLSPTYIIETQYAGDKPHDDNQLSSDWSYVGVGVSGTYTDLVFGGKKR